MFSSVSCLGQGTPCGSLFSALLLSLSLGQGTVELVMPYELWFKVTFNDQSKQKVVATKEEV